MAMLYCTASFVMVFAGVLQVELWRCDHGFCSFLRI